jgi:hypothetical protein
MAVMTAGCLIGAIESAALGSRYVLLLASIVIAAGSIVTCVNRSRAIASQLRQA